MDDFLLHTQFFKLLPFKMQLQVMDHLRKEEEAMKKSAEAMIMDALTAVLEDEPLEDGTYVHLVHCNASRNQPPGEADMCICLRSKKDLQRRLNNWKEYGTDLLNFYKYCQSIGVSLPWDSYEKFKKMDESLKKVQEQCFPKKEEPMVVENFKLVARLKAQDGYGRRDMVQRLVAEGYTVKEDIVKKEFSGVPDYFLLVYEKA